MMCLGYTAIGEAGPELATSIVFYDEEAQPRFSHLVSSYIAWENATTLRSTLTAGSIHSCAQHIEHFSYHENGDVADALNAEEHSRTNHTHEKTVGEIGSGRPPHKTR